MIKIGDLSVSIAIYGKRIQETKKGKKSKEIL